MRYGSSMADPPPPPIRLRALNPLYVFAIGLAVVVAIKLLLFTD
jgi:hypothetical protein